MENSKLSEALLLAALPFIVIYGLIRDEIEFWKLVHHHVKSKPLKDAEF
jgi:hypothetical protein